MRLEGKIDVVETLSSLPVSSSDDTLWGIVQQRSKTLLGEDVFNSWICQLSFFSEVEGIITLQAPSSFVQDWVQTHYSEDLLTLFQEEATTPVRDVRFTVVQAPASPDIRGTRTRSHLKLETASPDDGLGNEFLSSPLDPRLTFENFVVGKPNELGHAAARRVAESTVVPFNPLFLYGGVGLGKTHLMHAIAHHIQTTWRNRKVIYLSAEKFMYQFIRALRYKDTVSFKERFRSVDFLMIDDVQFIGGKESTQEEFFHTFNALVDQNRQVIVSADKSPSDLEGMEERLRSRLGWGLVADIHPTTYELRLGILQAKCEQLQCPIPKKVLEFLAHKISSNVRELEGALIRITAHANLVGREITLEMVQDVLRDLLRSNERTLTVDEIQRKVAEYYKVRISDLHSPKRSRSVARPRQVAMYLAKTCTSRSLPEIGRSFGGRDHTTILHGVKKIEELILEDASLHEDIDLLRRMLDA